MCRVFPWPPIYVGVPQIAKLLGCARMSAWRKVSAKKFGTVREFPNQRGLFVALSSLEDQVGTFSERQLMAVGFDLDEIEDYRAREARMLSSAEEASHG